MEAGLPVEQDKVPFYHVPLHQVPWRQVLGNLIAVCKCKELLQSPPIYLRVLHELEVAAVHLEDVAFKAVPLLT